MSFISSSIKLMPSCKWLLKSEVVRACLATNQVIIIIILSVSSNVDGDNSKLVFTCRTMNIPAQKS